MLVWGCHVNSLKFFMPSLVFFSSYCRFRLFFGVLRHIDTLEGLNIGKNAKKNLGFFLLKPSHRGFLCVVFQSRWQGEGDTFMRSD